MTTVTVTTTTASAAHVLLRRAREAAALTQREVADRAGTSQPVVARIETGAVRPDLDTLSRLLLACGVTLTLSTTPYDTTDLRQLDESLALSPAQRVERNRRQTALAARAAGARTRPLRPD